MDAHSHVHPPQKNNNYKKVYYLLYMLFRARLLLAFPYI